MTSFDGAFTNYARSPFLRTLFTSVFDPALPAEVEPFSFVPLSGLRSIAAAVDVPPDGLLLDVACGRGGPGLWVARERACRLLGFDLSPVALAAAASRAGRFGLSGRASYVAGSLTELALASSSVDGVVCVDAFFFAASMSDAAAEFFRVLRRGGRVVVTTWDWRGSPSTAQILASAGFSIVDEREPVDWEERRAAVYRAALSLPDVDSDPGLASLRREARRALPEFSDRRRAFVIAERPGREALSSAG